jgi:hypothetical protein
MPSTLSLIHHSATPRGGLRHSTAMVNLPVGKGVENSNVVTDFEAITTRNILCAVA